MIFGYTWRCVSCNFRKRSRDPFFTEGGRAEKIWRGKAEAAATAATAAATIAATAADTAAIQKE